VTQKMTPEVGRKDDASYKIEIGKRNRQEYGDGHVNKFGRQEHGDEDANRIEDPGGKSIWSKKPRIDTMLFQALVQNTCLASPLALPPQLTLAPVAVACTVPAALPCVYETPGGVDIINPNNLIMDTMSTASKTPPRAVASDCPIPKENSESNVPIRKERKERNTSDCEASSARRRCRRPRTSSLQRKRSRSRSSSKKRLQPRLSSSSLTKMRSRSFARSSSRQSSLRLDGKFKRKNFVDANREKHADMSDRSKSFKSTRDIRKDQHPEQSSSMTCRLLIDGSHINAIVGCNGEKINSMRTRHHLLQCEVLGLAKIPTYSPTVYK
jgi:hypothetical protein